VRPVDADNPPDFIQVNNTGGQAFGAIQRAPDGQLYVTQPGSSNLGTVAFNPNDIANSTFTPDGLQEPFPEGGSTGLGLPDYIDQGGNSFPEPSITVDDACVGLDINFSAQGRDNVIETYFWTVERLDTDGNAVYSVGLDSATAQSFTMPIDTVGRYRASVLLSNPCDIDTVLVQEFDVGQAAEITLPESANLCNGLVELTAIDPGTPDIGNYSFAWVQVGTVGGGSLPAQNTITVEEGGTYRVTVTNADGCENDGEVFVFDNRPEINLPEDFTLCQNETRELDVEIASPADPGYEWIILDTNDQQVAASNEPVIEVSELTPDPGLYRYTVTVTDNSPEGCFVRDTVVVTIEQAPELGEPTTTDPTCGNADGEISLDLAGADPATLTFAWVDPNGTAFSAGQTATGLASGNYQVTVSNAVGCSTTQTIGLNDSNADFTVDATGVAGCDSTGYLDVSLDLSALTGTGNLDIEITNVPGTYAFAYDVSNDPIPTFVVPTPPTLGPGTYNIQVTERTSGCRQTAEATIGSPPAVPVDLADRLISSCQSPATVEVLNFNTNYSYTWRNVSPGAQPGTGFSGPRTSFSAQVTQSGTYEVTVSDLSGTLCDSTRQVEVEILPPVIIDGVFVAENNSCETGEATLEVRFTDPADSARNLIYNWVRTDTSGLEQTLPQGGRVITVDQSGEYRVSVRERNNNDPSCAASASTSVAVSEPLSAAILFGNTCADGSDIPLVARVSPAVDNYRYDWFGPTGEQLPNTLGDTLLVTSNMPEGRYRVEVNSPDGCTTDATATIRRNPVPEVDLGETQIICTQDSDPEVNSVELSISETYAATTFSITWTRPGGLQELNTTTILANEAGTYTVEVSNQFGCVATDSVEILDDCRPRIVAPNAFRPNGVNNEFFVYSRYVAEEDFEVKIYNRWGELVYYSTDPDFRWDGTYNGQPAPLGTYPYVINYRASTSGDTGEVLEERGGITIVR
jgi:gliding motility-associated-like protein